MGPVNELSKEYNEYIPNITVEDFIVWIDAFLDDLKDAKKEYEKEKRRYKFKRFFIVIEYSDDDAFYSELNEVLDEGIRITLVLKDFAARVIPILSDNNSSELFKLMKYAADFYFKYTDYLDKKLDSIVARYNGINVTSVAKDTKDFEKFMNGQIDQEEEKTIPPVPKSEMTLLDKEYDSYIVDEKFVKSTDKTIFLRMCLDTQAKYLEKRARKFAHKSEICERVANFLGSDVLEKRSLCFEEMQMLTDEHRELLSLIKSATNDDNLDEMRKLADFSTHYYANNMKSVNEELGNALESNQLMINSKRRAVIKRFVMRKLKINPQKQLLNKI